MFKTKNSEHLVQQIFHVIQNYSDIIDNLFNMALPIFHIQGGSRGREGGAGGGRAVERGDDATRGHRVREPDNDNDRGGGGGGGAGGRCPRQGAAHLDVSQHYRRRPQRTIRALSLFEIFKN